MTAKRQDFYPLSPMQQGMLFHSLYAPESGVYVEQFSCTLQGSLNTAAFERAWRYLLERHTILRTAFVGQALKEPIQLVYQQAPLDIHQEDWRALDAAQRQAKLQAFMAADRQRGFDLAQAPLMRLALFRVAETAHEFVWTYHHVLLDGWSMPLLLTEFMTSYETFSGGNDGRTRESARQSSLNKPVPLPPARPYRDYIVWLRKQDLGKAEAFWRRTLQGLTAPTPLVIDRRDSAGSKSGEARETAGSGQSTERRDLHRSPVEAEDQGDGAPSSGDREVRLSTDVTAALQGLARRGRVTLNTIVQAAWALLLSRYSGEPDIVFGATVSGRPADLPGAETMVGLFINTLPIRVHVDEEQPLLAWLQSLQAQQVELQQYQYSPLVQIQGWSEVPRGQPLFETLMVFENYPVSSASLASARGGSSLGTERDNGGGLEIRNVRSVEQTNYPITFVVGVDREMMLRIIYDTRRLSDASIVRMLGHLRTLLEGMVAPFVSAADRLVKDLPLLTAAEQRYLLVELNNTARPDPQYLCIHHWFEAQAAQTPDSEAVSFKASSRAGQGNESDAVSSEGAFDDETLTYRGLNERANILAHFLRQRGVGPDVLVGLCMERSVDLIVGILAVLKAGGAYVPLDPAYPPERLAFMIGDMSTFALDGAGPIVITHSELVPLLRVGGSRPAASRRAPRPGEADILCMDEDWEEIARESSTENPDSGVMPDNLAYVIYTSGSTGKPKGTLLHHRGLCNMTRVFVDVCRPGPGSHILQFYSPSFDGSLSEIFPALLSGATLCLADREILGSPTDLWRLLRDERIDIAFIAPAMWGVLPQDPLPDLRVLTAGGEPLLPEVVQRWLTPGRRFINFYGPTETTITATYYEMDRPPVGVASLPIGRPIDNTFIYLLDSRLRLVPMGVPGELCVAGVQLARGYLNRPELTAAKFVPHPYSSSQLASDSGARQAMSSLPGDGRPRIYRTGDLARYLPDGNLEFLGRIDQQVKIRGYRIELGEIEAVLGQYPGVQQVAVVAREDAGGRAAVVGKRLVAYLCTEPRGDGQEASEAGLGQDYTTAALRSFLQSKLPAYMIPGSFVFLDALPLTPNGKVDRRALPSPEDARAEAAGSGAARAYVAPRDALEVHLARIWEQVLDVEPIGVLDDFFELGGHSLLAVRVIAQVEQTLGKKLPVMTLFQEPTIEAMATLLRQSPEAERSERLDADGRKKPDPSVLVSIQPHGSRPPLFFVHPSGGSVHWYTDLARRLGREQPFYGFQARGLEGDAPIDERIEDMAARYVREMRLAQPQGPYQLGSWSMGVIVAYEMACQLAEAGQVVSVLAILDQGPVLPTPKAEDQAAYLVETFGQNIPLSVEQLRQLPEEEQVPYVYQVARKKHFIYPDVKLEQFRHFIHILRTHTDAWREFTPREYPGRLTLFKAEKRPVSEAIAGEAESPDMGWGTLARGGVEIRWVPGDHLSMVHDPDVRALAKEMEACMIQARESPQQTISVRA